MKLIYGDEFIFYTSSMYEICLHCHWLGFSSFILNFEQCGEWWVEKFGTIGDFIYEWLLSVSRVLEKISAKIQSKLTKVCENGVDPTVCECDNVLLKELTFPVDNEVDIARCRPTRCSCAGKV